MDFLTEPEWAWLYFSYIKLFLQNSFNYSINKFTVKKRLKNRKLYSHRPSVTFIVIFAAYVAYRSAPQFFWERSAQPGPSSATKTHFWTRPCPSTWMIGWKVFSSSARLAMAGAGTAPRESTNDDGRRKSAPNLGLPASRVHQCYGASTIHYFKLPWPGGASSTPKCKARIDILIRSR